MLHFGGVRDVSAPKVRNASVTVKPVCAICDSAVKATVFLWGGCGAPAGATIALTGGEAGCCGLWLDALSQSGWEQRRCRCLARSPPAPVGWT